MSGKLTACKGDGNMKFENVKNVERLFQIIRDECSGTVELVSSEGDRINLKSRLSQYISMVRLLDTEFVKELELVASDPAAVDRLLRFMRDGE